MRTGSPWAGPRGGGCRPREPQGQSEAEQVRGAVAGTEQETGGKGKARRRPCPGNPNVVSHRHGVTEGLTRGVTGQLPLENSSSSPEGGPQQGRKWELPGAPRTGAAGAGLAPDAGGQAAVRAAVRRDSGNVGQSSRRGGSWPSALGAARVPNPVRRPSDPQRRGNRRPQSRCPPGAAVSSPPSLQPASSQGPMGVPRGARPWHAAGRRRGPGTWE